MTTKPREGRFGHHLRRWGAVYVLVILFAGSWLGQFATQLSQFASEQAQHGETFSWPQYWAEFFASTFENWQSEWLQLVFQAILLMGAKHLLFRTEAEDMERLEQKVDELRAQAGLAEAPPRDTEAAQDERRRQQGR